MVESSSEGSSAGAAFVNQPPTFYYQPIRTLGGEIASRLAYTQKSRGQNLPGRPNADWGDGVVD